MSHIRFRAADDLDLPPEVATIVIVHRDRTLVVQASDAPCELRAVIVNDLLERAEQASAATPAAAAPAPAAIGVRHKGARWRRISLPGVTLPRAEQVMAG